MNLTTNINNRVLHSFPTRRSSDLPGGMDNRLVAALEWSRYSFDPTQSFDSASSVTLIDPVRGALTRSEEHTSELQSLRHLVCRLLLEKKKKHWDYHNTHLIGRQTT